MNIKRIILRTLLVLATRSNSLIYLFQTEKRRIIREGARVTFTCVFRTATSRNICTRVVDKARSLWPQAPYKSRERGRGSPKPGSELRTLLAASGPCMRGDPNHVCLSAMFRDGEAAGRRPQVCGSSWVASHRPIAFRRVRISKINRLFGFRPGGSPDAPRIFSHGHCPDPLSLLIEFRSPEFLATIYRRRPAVIVTNSYPDSLR